MSDILGIVFNWENLQVIILLILGIVLPVIGLKYRKLFKEFADVVKIYLEAKQEDSPGGTTITKNEMKKIKDELFDVIREILNQFSGGIIGKILLLRKLLPKKGKK